MMMTNDEILKAAMRQSAYDLNCAPDDFLKSENVIVRSEPSKYAHKYLKLPFSVNLVSYGNNIVASVQPEYERLVRGYINFPGVHSYRCFETPYLHRLEKALEPYGQSLCFMAEYFLPDMERFRVLDCPYPTCVLHPEDFRELYLPQWSNALCSDRRELDVLGVGAYDGENLIGLAACSADCETMWQIGIDVLPEYRRRGIASALTTQLAQEIFRAGKIPFYCAAWSNLPSVGNAMKSGFRPAWVELTAKPEDFTESLNPRLTLRRGTAADAERVLDLYRAAVGRPGCTWDEEYPGQDTIEEDLRSGGLYVCEADGEIIGAASVVGENELDDLECWRRHDGKHREIARITVAQQYAGMGLACQMLMSLFEILQSGGCTSVRLLVAKCNPAALRTYEKLGFAYLASCEMYGNEYFAGEKLF